MELQRHLASLLLFGVLHTVETARFTRIADARLAAKQTELYLVVHLFKHTHQTEEVLKNSTTHQILHKWPMLDTAREALTELEQQLERNKELERNLPSLPQNNRFKRSMVSNAVTGASIIGGLTNRYSITTLQDKMTTAKSTQNALINVAEDTVHAMHGIDVDLHSTIDGITNLDKASWGRGNRGQRTGGRQPRAAAITNDEVLTFENQSSEN